MVFRMARPAKRNNSANAQFRQRVPTDLVDKLRGQVFVARLPVELGSSETITVQSKIGDTVVFSLRTTQGALLKARHAAAQQQVNAFFEAARRGPGFVLELGSITHERHFPIVGGSQFQALSRRLGLR